MSAPTRWFPTLAMLLTGVAIGFGFGAPLLLVLLGNLASLEQRSDGWVPRILSLIQQTGIFG